MRFLTQVYPAILAIWVGYSGCKRILSTHLILLRYSIFSKIHVWWAYAYNLYTYTEHTHTIVHVHWVYAYKLYGYAQHLLTNCMRMISIRLQIVWVCSAYAYKSQAYAQHTCKIYMIPMCFLLRVCWAYAYKLKSYAQWLCTNCVCLC